MSDKNRDDYSKDPIEWFLRAKMDLDVAENSFESMFPKPLEVIAGLSQQCAEKSIKAVYLTLGRINYPWIHDIGYLFEQIKNDVMIDKKFEDYSALLSSFKTETNYPTHIELDEAVIKKGIEFTKEIHQWAKEIVYQKKHIINHNKGFSR